MSDAATIVREARTAAGLTQAELASRLGTSQPVVARLESPGSNPRLQTLARAVSAAGRRLQLVTGALPGIDETLIASNLRLTPAERLRRFSSDYQSFRRLALAARERRGP